MDGGALPCGSWPSPVSAQLIAGGGVRLSSPEVAGGDVLWLEGRPAEGGRYALVRRTPDGARTDLTPAELSVRTRVHEYGGGAFLVHGAIAVVANFADQRLYRCETGRPPRAITPEPPSPAALRYADGRTTPDGELIVCVRESHAGGEVVNELVALPSDGSREPRVIASGSDFCAFPRVSPDGRRLAWTTWEHPRMPWDGTELWVADLRADGTQGDRTLVAGGDHESIFQPGWSPDGVLHFVSDRTGWWNLYRQAGAEIEALYPAEAEFGVPQWIFGLSTYAFLGDGRIACAYGGDPTSRLGLLEPGRGRMEELELSHRPGASLRSDGERLVFVGAAPAEAPAVVSADPATGACAVLARAMAEDVDPAFISEPRPITFATEGGAVAHALFYAPRHPTAAPLPGERPPLVVMGHGGPTSAASADLDLEIQFFTSRGLGVVDVDYRGSSGYGRAYREALRGQWGVADVADCVDAARHLAAAGEADAQRLAIRGSSAGGYTTLCALAFHDVFAAGASSYGVADAETLAQDTHKFESRYLDGLIGPYPQAAALYRERSPIHAVDRLSCPVILFQGLEDEVVPPAQAEEMVAALQRNGVPHAYLAFAGEQHGFRRAETIRRTLEAELSFYAQLFGFAPADAIEPVEIVGL